MEEEYISAGACCAQILYMKHSLLDYGVVLDRVPLLCDNESAVKIANNSVQHSRTKHIDIRHHFLWDHVAKEDIVLCGVLFEEQLADIFTKPLDENTFCRLQSELNVLDASNIMKFLSYSLCLHKYMIRGLSNLDEMVVSMGLSWAGGSLVSHKTCWKAHHE
jgi:hypothetical protein